MDIIKELNKIFFLVIQSVVDFATLTYILCNVNHKEVNKKVNFQAVKKYYDRAI